MKSVQWLLEDEHWLEALRPASHAKIQVMNQVVCVFFFTALTSGDAYKLRCESSRGARHRQRILFLHSDLRRWVQYFIQRSRWCTGSCHVQLCALGAVHVFLLHAALRASCFPCEWIQHCHPVVILLLCGISSCFASYLEDVAVVMRIGSTLFVRHKCRVFAASREHTSFVTCLVSSVPKRKKIIQKMREGATCVSSRLQRKWGRAMEDV